jgi:hypothetical protein
MSGAEGLADETCNHFRFISASRRSPKDIERPGLTDVVEKGLDPIVVPLDAAWVGL